jgi:YidC/Oxa1 family membrane protein insertase
LSADSGLNWALSIIALVMTARLLLFRLFIKQVHFQRRMQEMAPKLNDIKVKYKDDRAAQQRETVKLQQQEGFNPLTGCLPMFLQIPVFLGLYHVLRHLANSVAAANRVPKGPGSIKQLTLYGFSQSETISAAKAKLFGAPLAGSFRDSAAALAKLGGDPTTMRLVVLPLLLISAAATFLTQLLSRANQTVAPSGTNAQLQKLFLYVFPLGVLASGLIFNFPLGVLLYWFTSNTWTLVQQLYINRFHPVIPPSGDIGEPFPVQKGGPPDVGHSPPPVKPRPGQRPSRPTRPSTQRKPKAKKR